MDLQPDAHSLDKRHVVESLDREFARLHLQSCTLIENTPAEVLYRETEGLASTSVGASVLRYAATIEQTFGGITANLWDDPFEWTLPEHLSTPAKVIEHLNEVEATRARAFTSFPDDACLLKHIALSSGETQQLIKAIQETLARAGMYLAQAAATLKLLSGISPPGFII